MDASDETIITLYNIILDPAAWPTGPNPWKARPQTYLIPYRTIWVPLSEVGATRNFLGLPAVRKHQDGSPFPTLPIVRVPYVLHRGDEKGDALLGDSFDIAVHLSKYMDLKLFPGEEGGPVAMHRAFNSFVDQLFSQYGVPLAGFYMPLDPRTAESNKAVILQRFPEKEDGTARKWEDFEVPPGSALRAKMLAEFEGALDEKLAPCFPGSGGDRLDDGFMRGCLPEWEELRDKWSGGRLGRLLDGFKEKVDRREGVVPARH
ncbi:hypothetical protein PG994_001441 [Apiospora phragmitis]|uniref:GST N-terminal domain-containing protein n=1 Tax=Apiospora phragmitis TaxID=2905665 RepID=A0ABR1WTI7_9PEZI